MGINFSRNSWHRRLHAYVLDRSTYSYDDIVNLCPYFWLTLFCVLAFPFMFISNTCKRGSLFIVDKISSNKIVKDWTRQYTEWREIREEAFFSTLPFTKLLEYQNSDREVFYRIFLDWCSYATKKGLAKQKGYDTSLDYFYALRKEHYTRTQEQSQKLQQEKRARRARRELIFQRISMAITFVLVPVVLFFVGQLVYILWTDYEIDWQLLGGILLTLAGLTVLVFSFYFLDILATRYEVFPRLFKGIWFVFKILCWYPLKYIFIVFREIFKFAGLYFRTVKDNYCPSIKWNND